MTTNGHDLQQWADKATTVIRVSALSTYHDCPRRNAVQLFRARVMEAGFRLRYLPRSIGAIVGSAVHRGAAYMLDVKAKTGTLSARGDALEAARDTFDGQVDGAEVLFDGPNGKTHNKAEAITAVAKMTAIYHTVIAPAISPIKVEERLEAAVAPGVILSGQPDLVCREPGAVRDLKTGARVPPSFAPQLGGYSLLARSHGLSIERAAIDFIPRVRAQKPQPFPTTHEAVVAHAEGAAVNILHHITTDLDAFTKGDDERHLEPGNPWAFAANPASMLCSPKYCAAYGTEFCHEGRQHHERN